MRARTSILILIAAAFTLVLAAQPAGAKDIRLGGTDEKLPKNIVQLPTIAVAMRTEDGGWRHIKIDAWLAAKDVRTAKAMESVKNTIIAKADRELPNHDFATLQSAELGSNEAKKVIVAAVEATIGREYKGEVLIRSMLVY
jgi:hypothetical protein